MNRFGQSIQLVEEAYSLGWRNKNLFWYGILLALALVVPFYLLVIYVIGAGNTLYLQSAFQALMVLSVLIFFISFIVNIFLATLLNRIYALINHKEMSFKKSFSFKEGVLWKIASLLVISVFIHILQNSRVNELIVSYVGKGVLVWGLLYTIFLSISLLWSIASAYFLAILVKENKGFLQTLKCSWQLAWNNLLITGVAFIVTSVCNVCLLLMVVAAGAGITYIIGLLFSIGFSLNWWLIFGAVVGAPILYLMCYIFVVLVILRALFYVRLNKSR